MPRIEGLTIEIGADAKKFSSEIKGMDKALAKTRTSLQKVGTALRFNPGNTDLIKQKQQLLGREIDQTKQKLARLKEEEDRLKQTDGFDENSEDAQRLRREIIQTESKLKSFEREAAKVASVFGVKMQAVGRRMQDIGRSVTRVGDTLSTRVTLPLVGAGTIAAKKFAEVDKTMQLTNATMSNTEAEANQINTAMKEAAANSTFGMKDAAQASLNFARAGLDAAQAASTLAPAMNLAAGEGGNLDTVSGGLVATINGFSDSFDSASKYADVFANACNNSALDIDGLSNAMSIAAPVFSAAGYSVNDAALYMGVMANKGIKANKAANSLKTGISRLVKPTDEAAGWLEKLGVEVTNADGSMKDSVTVQKDLHEAFSTLSESEQIAAASAIFGKNQMAPWLALINTAPSEVNKLSGALKQEGTTSEMADKMMSGFGGSIEKLKSSIDVAATSLGEALAPSIKGVSDRIQGAVDKFNAMSGAEQQAVVKTGLLVAAAGPLLSIGGRLITGLGSVIEMSGKAVTKLAAIAKGTATFSAGPAVAAIGALAALTYAGYKMAKSSDDAARAEHDLDKTEQEHVSTLESASKAYEETDKARKDATATAESEAAYAQDLVKEYNSIIGANGKVKKGYEDRANFIKGQLAEALGIEIGQIEDLIGENGRLKASIQQVIETKKAEAILAANEDAYTKAVNERKTAVEKLGPALRDLKSQQAEYAQTQQTLAQRQREYNNYVESGGRNTAQYNQRLEAAKLANEGAAQGVKRAQKAVNDYERTLNKANTEIKNYEGLAQAIASKDAAAIERWSATLQSGLKTRENATRKELQQQAKTVNEEYKLIREAYNKGDAGVTRQMVREARTRRNAANKEAGVVTSAAKKKSKAAADSAASVSASSAKEKNAVSKNSAAAKNAVSSNSAAAKKSATSNFGAASRAASSDFKSMASSASTQMASVSDSVKGAAGTAKSSFPVDLGQLFHGTLVNITTQVKEKAGGAKDISQSIQKAKFARGYTNPLLFTSPTLVPALFGDRGSAYGGEMVYSKGKLLDDIREATGGGRGPITINLTVNGVNDPHAIVAPVIDELERYVRTI